MATAASTWLAGFWNHAVTVFLNTCDLGTGRPGDLDESGVVDGADLAILLGAWGACPPAERGGDGDCGACPADLNGDCTVDGADLAILLGNWG